jgi:outer membrane protein TolC
LRTNIVIAAIEYIQREIRTITDVLCDTEDLTEDELMQLEAVYDYLTESLDALKNASEVIGGMERLKEQK